MCWELVTTECSSKNQAFLQTPSRHKSNTQGWGVGESQAMGRSQWNTVFWTRLRPAFPSFNTDMVTCRRSSQHPSRQRETQWVTEQREDTQGRRGMVSDVWEEREGRLGAGARHEQDILYACVKLSKNKEKIFLRKYNTNLKKMRSDCLQVTEVHETPVLKLSLSHIGEKDLWDVKVWGRNGSKGFRKLMA